MMGTVPLMQCRGPCLRGAASQRKSVPARTSAVGSQVNNLRAQLAAPIAIYPVNAVRHTRRVTARFAKDDKQEATTVGPEPVAGSKAAAVAAADAMPAASTGTAASTNSTTSSRPSRRQPSEATRNIRQQQRLLQQLLGRGSVSSVSSLSSIDSVDFDPAPTPSMQQPQQPQQQHRQPHQNIMAAASKAAAAEQPTADAVSSNRRTAPASTLSKRQPGGLYDDESAADYDPIMLDMLGFTSVAQYLQYKLDTAAKQAKVDSIGAVIWGSLAFGVLSNMGGHAAYMQYIRELTLNGSVSDNLVFLWVYTIGYFTVKSCFLSFATGWRAMSARMAEAQQVQELEKMEKQHQRLAFWQLQEKLDRFDNRANRTFTEFALASMLLGILIFMKGGLDNLTLQMETVDQQALCGLLVMMWLFWESYFAGIGAVVQLVTVATHFIEKWQHKQKWEKDNSE